MEETLTFLGEKVAYWAAVLGASIVTAWSGSDIVIQVYAVLALLDLITGIIMAGVTGYPRIDSSIGYLGWRRKAMTVLVILAAYWLQGLSAQLTDIPLPVAQVLAAGFAVMEFLSIIENAGRAGVRYPKLVAQMFEKLRDYAEPSSDGSHNVR